VAQLVPQQWAYQLQDSTGTIWVLTNQAGLQLEDKVLIKGNIHYQSIPLAGKDFGEVYARARTARTYFQIGNGCLIPEIMTQPIQVAIAILHRQGQFLLQLRDNIPGIVYPGHWVCLAVTEPGETPAVAVERELLEEISYAPPTLLEFGCYADDNVIRHVYHAADSGTQSAGSRRRLGHGFIDAGSDSTGQLILKSGRSGATLALLSTNFVGFHEQGLIKKA